MQQLKRGKQQKSVNLKSIFYMQFNGKYTEVKQKRDSEAQKTEREKNVVEHRT